MTLGVRGNRYVNIQMSHLLKINQTMAETAVLMRLIIETLSGPGALRYVRDKQKTLNSIIFFIADFALLH